MNIHQYYQHPDVRRCLWEYLLGSNDQPSCHYVVGYGEELLRRGHHRPFESVSIEELGGLLDADLDVFRSVWDWEGTLLAFDVEYFNLDFPGEVYLHSHDVFAATEPLFWAVEELFDSLNLPHLAIMTGQGYHFVCRVPFSQPVHGRLEQIVRVPDTVMGKYRHLREGSRRDHAVSEQAAYGYEAVGRILEFLCHWLIREIQPQIPLPLRISDVAVGGASGDSREAISLDITMYGDPVYMRDIRLPFSTHQKHKVQRGKVGEDVARGTPVQIAVTRRGAGPELGLEDALATRRHFENAANWASQQGCRIPDGSEGVYRILEAYLDSDLFQFHQDFDSTDQEPWQAWNDTYDRVQPHDLPDHVGWCISDPNPALLTPTHLVKFIRALMDRGWHPKHIAGLIRSKYERSYGWDENWEKYDANLRALFWVRVYAGLISVGLL